MKLLIKKLYFQTLLLAFLVGLGCAGKLMAQQAKKNDLISPIHGKIMMMGEGEISTRAYETFAYLSGEENGKLVIICNKAKKAIRASNEWEKFIKAVSLITFDESDKKISDEAIEMIKEATAVWLYDDLSKHFANTQLKEELAALLHRDGVIGGQGRAAESMAMLVEDGKNFHAGFNLIPNSFIQADRNNYEAFVETVNSMPGRLGWYIPPKSSVVIHDGRKISVITFPEIRLLTAANGPWKERHDSYGPAIDELPYSADLIAWNRSGISRLGEAFPPAIAPVPEVPNGALMIIGGSGYPDGLWKKIVDYAGGKNANYVCLSQSERSWGAEHLWELGCKNVAVHMVETGVDGIGQGSEPQLLEDLKNADAVYFGGGRTYKYLDAYMNTPAHELMKKVLERGGLIVGTSAGAQIQGDYLVRGDPRTNKSLFLEGSDQGLGFLKGVIIDAHFRERGRHKSTPQLLAKYPQMLGIGIDETTAIFVQGTIAEVFGPHAVTFYDLKNQKKTDPTEKDIGNPVILMEGEKYDLEKRKKIGEPTNH